MTSMGPIEKPKSDEEVVDMDELSRQQDPDEVEDIESDDDEDEIEDPEDVDNLD